MKRLKDLRVASGMTQAQIAKLLNTTQQTYARWEGGKAEPPIAALRDLSIIFSTTVDYILGRGPAKPATTRYYLMAEDGDGFWGHIGLLLPGMEKTRWYPITAGQMSQLRGNLGAGYDVSEWAIVETLNNHVLIFRPTEMQRIWILDDACDQPAGDWEWKTVWNDYNGIPIELYRAMGDWADDQICGFGDFEENNSEVMREQALALIQEGGFQDDPEKLDAFLRNTVIHFVDGTTTEYHADRQDIARLATELDGESDIQIIEISADGGDFESFYPTARVRLIDIPTVELEAGYEELNRELEREED